MCDLDVKTGPVYERSGPGPIGSCKEQDVKISIKRIYEPAAKSDGKRILVDRIWPRGIKKAEAGVDLWLKDVAPSTELRKWFGHDPEKWVAFQKKYKAELKGSPALAELKAAVKDQSVTLLFAAKDEDHNNAVVLKKILSGKI